MPEFPSSPIEPAEFLGNFLPEFFAGLEIPVALSKLDESLGLLLHGDSGGAWRIRVRGGEIRVEAAEPEGSALTLVQSVEDWRGALWEGRGGAFGEYAAKLFDPGAAALFVEAGEGVPAALDPSFFEPLREIEGLLAVVVTGGEGGDWRIGVKLGPGPIPGEPCATISIDVDAAAALRSGQMKMLEAFIVGHIQVAGDVGLVMQLQGALMQVAAELRAD